MTQAIFKYVNLFTFPLIFIFAALIPEFVAVVFTDKWKPAIPAFYFLSLRMLGSNITTLYVSVLNALGQVKTSLRILVWWTLADWALALAFLPYGFTGIAMAYGLSVLPVSVWLLRELNRFTRVNLMRSFCRPLLLSAAAGAFVFIFKSRFTPSWGAVFGLAGAGLVIFVLLLFIVEQGVLLAEGKVFLLAVLKRE
jgi:O-antigen/teichoic acid export membrane protein